MTPLKPIVTDPHSILRAKAKPVPEKQIVDTQFQAIIADMRATLDATPHGIGLAAPQIGHSWRIFIVKIPEYQGVFVNPEVMETGVRTGILEEGCLSVPLIYGAVVRPKTIKIKTYDENGKQFKLRAKALLARVIQHELDHLDGKLFIDKAERTYKQKIEE